MKKILNKIAVLAIAAAAGSVLTSWTTEQTNYKQLYEIERTKTKAAEKVIDEVIRDWDSFYDTVGEGDAWFDYCDAMGY